jgi:hypothetical protein
MIALGLALAGLSGLVAGFLLLRSGGPRVRVGRLLASAPSLTLDQVVAAARSGEARYVRTHGRISSDEEFPDEHDRPLVYRRQRLDRASVDGGWTPVQDERLAVPFGIEDRQTFVAVDVDALGDGLVVIPREASGTADELPPEVVSRLPPMAPDTRVRLRVEQVSAVEHATAVGVPRLDASGAAILGAGLGRPLILSPLPQDAAMRVLAAPQRRRVVLAAIVLVAGLGLIAGALVALVVGV